MSYFTKQDVFELFDERISRTVIHRDSSEDEESAFILGRNTRVTVFPPSLIDLWIFNTNRNRINRFLEIMSDYELEDSHEWEREAMIQTYDPAAITDNLKFLRIRRKRSGSPRPGWVK